MQTKNVYLEAYAKVCEPVTDDTDEHIDEEEFYEEQLKNADIPNDMLYRVYVELKNKYGKKMDDLSRENIEMSRRLYQYHDPEHQAKFLLDREQSNNLDSFAYAVVAAMVFIFILDHFVYKVQLIAVMNNLTSGYGLKTLIMVLPVFVLAFILSKILLRKYRMPRFLREYEEEYEQLKMEYEDVNREYHHKKAMFNVIRRACNAKNESPIENKAWSD